MQSRTSFKGVLILLITAFVWGSSFLAQKFGTDSGVEPFTFQAVRTLLGSVVLLPVILFRKKVFNQKFSRESTKKVLIFGSILGVLLCAATNLQQYAFLYESSAGKIAFITAMYIFLVPIVSLFFRKKIPLLTWFCIAAGFVGLYFLCIKEEGFGSINRGDVLTLLCSVFFCVQILCLERFSPECDGVQLACMQFFVSGIISFVLMLIFDNPSIAVLKTALFPILYSGILSCGVAYTLQIIGQKYCEATIASLLMCTESVFAVIVEALVLHQLPSFWEGIGCVIMFGAIILSQIAAMRTTRSTAVQDK